MRANSPTEDFGLLNPVEDDSESVNKVPEDVKKLAKAAKTKDGQIILDHLQKRIDDFTNVLKSSPVTDTDPQMALSRFMAAQIVIQEFEAVLRDVEISKQTVHDAQGA